MRMDDQKRKVLKPNGSNVSSHKSRSHDSENYRQRKSHGSYWLHDDRDIFDHTRSEKEETCGKDREKKEDCTRERKVHSNREVLLPKRIREKEESKRERGGAPTAEDKPGNVVV